MPANLENSVVATGLEKISFHSNHKGGQCQRMFKLLKNCAHFTCQKGNAQNPSSQAPTICEPDVQVEYRQGRGTRNQIANICCIKEKARELQKKSTTAQLH